MATGGRQRWGPGAAWCEPQEDCTDPPLETTFDLLEVELLGAMEGVPAELRPMCWGSSAAWCEPREDCTDPPPVAPPDPLEVGFPGVIEGVLAGLRPMCELLERPGASLTVETAVPVLAAVDVVEVVA